MSNTSVRVRVEDHLTGSKPSWRQASIRYLLLGAVVYLLSFSLGWAPLLAFAIFIIDYFIVPLVDKKRRALHDILAGTVVHQLPKQWAHDNPLAHSPGRKSLFRLSMVLLIVMVAVGSLTTYSNREASSNIAWGVAQELARSAESTAPAHHHPVTLKDIGAAMNTGIAMPLHGFSEYTETQGPKNKAGILVRNQLACITLSGRIGVTPTVSSCPNGMNTFNRPV
jgi:hypothetical protein